MLDVPLFYHTYPFELNETITKHKSKHVILHLFTQIKAFTQMYYI